MSFSLCLVSKEDSTLVLEYSGFRMGKLPEHILNLKRGFRSFDLSSRTFRSWSHQKTTSTGTVQFLSVRSGGVELFGKRERWQVRRIRQS